MRVLLLVLSVLRIAVFWLLCLVVAIGVAPITTADGDATFILLGISGVAAIVLEFLWRRWRRGKRQKEQPASNNDAPAETVFDRAGLDTGRARAEPVLAERDKTALLVFVGCVVVCGGGYSLFFGFPAGGDGGWGVFFGFFVLPLAMTGAIESRRKRRARRPHQYVELQKVVGEHYGALRRNLARAVKHNDYGAPVSDDRRQVLVEFLASIDVELNAFSEDERLQLVLQAVAERGTLLMEDSAFDPEDLPADGFDFEHWVAENLTRFGWDAKATAGSGDQGLDVIAEKAGVKVGIQCKLYSGNVGNKAVQEIIAARQHFNLHAAAVMTNADYTRSARELAESCGVALLTPHDIPDFDRRFLPPS